MRFYLLSCVSLLVSAELFAQQPVFRSQTANLSIYSSNSLQTSTKAKNFVSKEDTQTQAPKKRVSPAGINIHLLPLFGEYEKTASQLATDQEFIKACDLSFKTRSEASEFFSARAWEYLAEGQRDTATYRFNLAYLLDDENVDAFWGLGVISYQNEKYEEAIKLMRHGLEISDNDNVTLIVDLSTVYLKCFTVDSKKEDLTTAFELLNKAITKQPEFANAYMQLSLAKLLNNELDEAWANFHKGYTLDSNSVSIETLQALLSKKEDPKGIFTKTN